MSNITIELPDHLSADDARLSLAIALYVERRVSQGEAAKIAGYSRATFIELLGKRGVSFTNITPDEFSEELKTWQELPSRTARP